VAPLLEHVSLPVVVVQLVLVDPLLGYIEALVMALQEVTLWLFLVDPSLEIVVAVPLLVVIVKI
jgi:hypothetical protein